MKKYLLIIMLILYISSASAYVFTPLRNDIWGDTIVPNQGNNAVEITNYNSSGFNSILISCSGASCSDDGFNSTGGLLQRDNITYSLTSPSRMKRYFNDGFSRAYIYMSAQSSPFYCAFNTILNGWSCTNAGITATNYRGGDFLQYITGISNYNIFIYTQTNSFIAEYDTFTQAFTFPATQLAGITCQNINPDSTAIIRTMNTLGNPQNGRLDQTFTNSYAIGSIPSGNGRAGCKIYSAQDGGIGWWTGDSTHQAQLFKLNNLANFSQTTEYNTLSQNCANIFALPQMNIYGVDCKNDNECVAVGAYGNNANAMAFGFNKTDCNYLYPINTEYNASYLMDTAYEPISGKYFITGKNALFTIQSPMIPNAGSNTSQPASPVTNTISSSDIIYINLDPSKNSNVLNADGSSATQVLNASTASGNTFLAYDILRGLPFLNALFLLSESISGYHHVSPVAKMFTVATPSSLTYDLLTPYHSGSYAYNCKYDENQIFTEPFNYTDQISNHGWTDACAYTPIFADTRLPSALTFTNGTCINDIIYDMGSKSSLTEKYHLHYYINPKAYAPLINETAIVSLRDSAGRDISPLQFVFTADYPISFNASQLGNSHLLNNPQICINYFNQQNATPALLGCLNANNGLEVDEYIDFQSQTFSVRAFPVSDIFINPGYQPFYINNNIGQQLYSKNLALYNPSISSIRYVYMNPTEQSYTLFGDLALTSYNITGFFNYDYTQTLGTTGSNTILADIPITCQYTQGGDTNLVVYNTPYANNYVNQAFFGLTTNLAVNTGQNTTNTGNGELINVVPGEGGSLNIDVIPADTKTLLGTAITIIAVIITMLGCMRLGIKGAIAGALSAGVGVLSLIFFTINGYLPYYVLVFLAFIVAVIIYIFVRKTTIGGIEG